MELPRKTWVRCVPVRWRRALGAEGTVSSGSYGRVSSREATEMDRLERALAVAGAARAHVLLVRVQHRTCACRGGR